MSNDVIRERIEKFVAELEVLVRKAAIESVQAALGGAAPAPAARATRSAPVAAAKAPAAAASVPAAGKLSFKRKKGAKRTPEQLAQIDAAAVAFVKANPGKGVEHMAKSLGVPSNDLKSRISILIDGKRLKKTGFKRATKYYPV